jgi:hypothetical protein
MYCHYCGHQAVGMCPACGHRFCSNHRSFMLSSVCKKCSLAIWMGIVGVTAFAAVIVAGVYFLAVRGS